MVKLGTMCSECCLFSDGKCSVGLHEKWLTAGANVNHTDGDVVIDRICMYRRPHTWQPDKTKDVLDQLKEEVSIPGTIVLFHHTGPTSNLATVIEKINSSDITKKFKLTICCADQYDLSLVVKEAKKFKTDKWTVVKLFDVFNDEQASSEVFRKAKNGYLFFLDSSQDFEPSIFDKINYYVNEKLQRLLLVKQVGNFYHQSVCIAPLFKFVHGNKNMTFEDKIIAMADQQGCLNQILTWDDINEACKY